MEENRKYKSKVIVIEVQNNRNRAKNNCQGDICLMTEEYLLISDILNLIFYILETSKQIEVSGEIVSSEYFIDEGYCCNYINFISVKNEDKDFINEFLNNAIIGLRVKNIGTGGICLISETDLPVSTIINLMLHLTELSNTIKVTGKIVWNEREYMVDNDAFYCGVMFTKMPKKYEELLQEYVANNFFDIRHNKSILELLSKD